MRPLIAALLTLAIAVPASAQQLTDQQAAHLRSANRKITLGLVLMSAGALAAPLTALNRRRGDPGGGAAMSTSVGVMVLGSGIAWWGAMDRRRAVQPQIAIGIGLGKAKNIRVTRTW